MMATILNSANLDLAILNKTLTQISSIWLKLIHSPLTWWWQHILNSAIMDSAIQHKKSHSFILTQLNDCSHIEFCHVGFSTAILDSDSLLSSLRFTQKHSPSTLTLTQTNSIWLKLIHSLLTWMMAAILNSAILNLAILEPAILVFPLNLTHTYQD